MHVQQAATLALLSDAIKAGIHQVVDELDLGDAEPGPPLAERKKKIQVLDEIIEQASAELADLRRQANEAGLDVSRAAVAPNLTKPDGGEERKTIARREKAVRKSKA